MKNFTRLFILLLLAAPMAVNASHLRDQIVLSARLTGSQEVPAVPTTAQGVAALTLSSDRDSLCITMTVTGLSGPITGAHIHSGAVGVNGPVVFHLTDFLVGNSLTATITGSDLTADLLADYLHGMLYVNVHTDDHPGGEIRGQITPESDHQFVAMLSGGQQSPPVDTDAMGLAVLTLSKHSGKLMIRVVVDNLSGPITDAHLHLGGIGENGPVAIGLSEFISGNTISGTVDPSANLMDLMAGDLYLNIHTAANPNGEIRGQVMAQRVLSFDAWLDGAQQTPAVATDAKGIADVQLSSTFDTLWYHVQWTGLTDQATGAHFHEAIPGSSGPVVLDISDDIDGNHIMGMITGSALTDDIIGDLLSGALYINIHNATYPNGEIRGQVYRVLREGYSALIEGSQQVPPVSTNALGTVVASIDRNQTDLHYMVVADGLDVEGAHFHKGMEGVNGPVIFDLTDDFMNGGVAGYWLSTDATPFVTANSLMFRNDSIYINLHTAEYPNGEIRGQLDRGYSCNSITIGIDENDVRLSPVSVYPNPVNDNLTIALDANQHFRSQLLITDMQGRIVATQNAVIGYGNNRIEMDASALNEGMYMIQFLSDGRQQGMTRFIKQ